MTDIPYDVWECVTSYVSDEYLKELYSLNPAFFHASMAERYRTVKLERYTNLKVIEHLRDSDISKLVRRLEFYYPWFPEADSRIVAGILRAQLSAMSGMLAYLNDIQEIFIVWDTMEVPMEFFASIWNAFGTNLKKLTIDASLPKSIHMLASHPTFPSLEDMELAIRGGNTIQDGALNEGCLYRCFSSTIRRLKVHSYHVDPSNIFSLLPCFTDLRVLHVTVDTLCDLTCLVNLLIRHAHTLKDVALEEMTSSTQSNQWMKHFFGEHVNEHTLPLSNLQSLSLIPSRLPLDVLEVCLHRSSDTLTSLALPNNCLTYNQLEKVVTIFSRAQLLKNLHVSVFTITPETFDLLASKLPGLARLILIYSNIIGLPGSAHLNTSSHLPLGQYKILRRELSKKSYPQWKLQDIAISQWRKGAQFGPPEWSVMTAVAKATPSVRSLAGQGNTEIPEVYHNAYFDELGT
ncbi:uncharacterized protein EV420DRAFT_1646725 [Desarmillaria tabescens]|uniref:Uncharacterized protein n=1 Tax=Armillaria tabescens TaxID=1929756 RepID=A0AA39MX00_ARMTA|nr:uncharacterized protein EV420DRAFT_1646725 [Desarmillaria tabescens]KAK0449732.1 hypothetical protein EV420DRAFT_1646725 [Desarmillaria tabescens]